MNFIKRHLLERELLSLEYKITRFYALSTWRTELENKQGNIIQKLFSRYFLHKANIEYESLSTGIQNIEFRIIGIKSELREY